MKRLAADQVTAELPSELGRDDPMSKIFLDGLAVGALLLEAGSGRIIFANHTFCEMMQRSPDEFTAAAVRIEQLVHPRDQSWPEDGQTRQKGFVRKDGSLVWGQVGSTLIRDRVGHPRWIASVVERTPGARVAEQLLRAVKVDGELATWNWSPKLNSMDCTPGCNAMFGIPDSASSWSLEEFLEHVHPHEREAVASALKRALAGGAYLQEYRIVREDGGVRWLRGIAKNVTNATGDVTNLIGAVLDITDLKLVRELEVKSRMVIQYIESNLSKPLSVVKIGAGCGLSPRSVYNYFSSRGTTPMKFVRQIRLQRARQKLSKPKANTSITSTALSCGFSSLGHFARQYELEFGELPSETLKRSR